MNTSESLAEGIQLLELANKSSPSSMITPPPSEEKTALSSQKSTSAHSDNNEKQQAVSDEKNTYVESLKEERDQLIQYANGLNHVFTLIDKEIKKVTGEGDDKTSIKEPAPLLTDEILVPIEEYPTYNFVGRILGPRGTTAKQLEATTGCKVTILGRCKKEGAMSAEANAPSDGPLRVQISCPSDAPDAEERMKAGTSVIKALLIPPADGQDELKRQQLMILANMNGTYRPRQPAAQLAYTTGAGDYGHQFQNLLPYGYRLPKSQDNMSLNSLMTNEPNHSNHLKLDCFNPKCAILRNLIEQNAPMTNNSIPKIDDVLSVMHMYELMNRIRLANVSLFGEPRQNEEVAKAQEIGNRMCSALGNLGKRSTSTPNQLAAQRRTYKPRQEAKK